MIDGKKLIESLKYSSIYNKPCPEWVYRTIEAFDKEKENIDECVRTNE